MDSRLTTASCAEKGSEYRRRPFACQRRPDGRPAAGFGAQALQDRRYLGADQAAGPRRPVRLDRRDAAASVIAGLRPAPLSRPRSSASARAATAWRCFMRGRSICRSRCRRAGPRPARHAARRRLGRPARCGAGGGAEPRGAGLPAFHAMRRLHAPASGCGRLRGLQARPDRHRAGTPRLGRGCRSPSRGSARRAAGGGSASRSGAPRAAARSAFMKRPARASCRSSNARWRCPRSSTCCPRLRLAWNIACRSQAWPMCP